MNPINYEKLLSYFLPSRTYVFGLANEPIVRPQELALQQKKVQVLQEPHKVKEKDLKREIADATKRIVESKHRALTFNSTGDGFVDNLEALALVQVLYQESDNPALFEKLEDNHIEIGSTWRGYHVFDLTKTLDGAVKAHYSMMVRQS